MVSVSRESSGEAPKPEEFAPSITFTSEDKSWYDSSVYGQKKRLPTNALSKVKELSTGAVTKKLRYLKTVNEKVKENPGKLVFVQVLDQLHLPLACLDKVYSQWKSEAPTIQFVIVDVADAETVITRLGVQCD